MWVYVSRQAWFVLPDLLSPSSCLQILMTCLPIEDDNREMLAKSVSLIQTSTQMQQRRNRAAAALRAAAAALAGRRQAARSRDCFVPPCTPS